MKKIIIMMSLIIASIFFTASTQIMIMQKFAQKETTTYAEDVYLARLNMSYVKDKEMLSFTIQLTI